ncbi:hypothetical protein HG537_0C00200 [Torulaspora globosa]|uniref:RhoGAP-domain-containing protein n=1 Tax=Torulaspora globosa TaxID=48254 RepID=A0A7H9HQ03_9SACH|nr:hypothetical protein HG537_0C00200 [Torulaspora sp. CBS 2947]
MQVSSETGEYKRQQTVGQDFTASDQAKSYKKVCARCRKPITQSNRNGKTTLKALGKYYHEDCFTCSDCGSLLKPKYFPYELEKGETILLCQYDYFKRHNLLCFVCDKPLRGLYYTAFGERYDEEHFSCTICAAPCGVKKCFMYQNKLYCKYHFLKYFSKRCSGCNYPISDQYIEFPKGEEVHCWHPECYGIHKYWHVNLSADTLGLPSFPKLKYQEGASSSNPTPKELDKQMHAFSSILSRTWSVLYRFEEETACCISDMFQYLAIFDQIKGINSTALFVLKIECLFKGIGTFDVRDKDRSPSNAAQNSTLQIQDTNNNSENVSLKYSKFPRNLSTKIMIYLQLLRKLNAEDSKVNVSSFMPVITGLTHFLKLLTRYGLYNALEKNKAAHSMTPLMKFLREVERNEIYEKDPFSYIDLPINATDNCTACGKYIQEDCIQFHENRWHIHCFTCSQCQKSIEPRDIADATYNKTLRHVICPRCSVGDPASVPGFKYVTKLAQLIFLLKIALIRSKAVMETQMRTRLNKSPEKMDSTSVSMQQTYIRTLNDIKRLRSRRECVRVTHDKQQARKSVVLETGEHDVNKVLPQQNGNLVIHTDPPVPSENTGHDNVFTDTKTLTLDDISRIVAAEHARELRPNAFTHFKKIRETDSDTVSVIAKKSGIYYSELTKSDMTLLQMISLSLLTLDQRIIAKDVDVSKLIPPPLKNEKSPASNGFWYRMKYMMNKEPKKVNCAKVFGTPLDSLTAKWGVDSELGIGPVKIKIPIIVDELISTLRQMDMSVEGIFRKNGNIKRLKKLTNEIDSNPGIMPDLSKENAIQLSALLKKYIRELPDPLLTSELYNIWINAAKLEGESEKQRIISLVYCMLPMHNRNVLEVLLSFLCWTASFSHIENEMGSKMDIHNLSTVITPNVLYLPDSTVPKVTITEVSDTYDDAFAHNEGENYFLAIEMIDYLITHNEDMGMVPKFLMTLLKEIKNDNICSYDLVKDFVTKKYNSHDIDFSEFEIQRNIEMKHSTSLVTQGEVLK